MHRRPMDYPSALANCFDMRSLPPVMVSDCACGIVIVLVSFDIEKSEPGFAVAHCKIERLDLTEVFRLSAA